MFAVLFTVAGFLGLKLWRVIEASHSRGPLAASGAILAVIATPLMLASAAPLVYVVASGQLGVYAAEPKGERDLERSAGFRFELAQLAIDRGLDSGMLGLGPGPHLTRPPDLREPEMDAVPNFEAHNTLLDVFLQGGLLAVVCLIWIVGKAVSATLNEKLSLLPVALVGISGFALSHFILRHPIFWFLIAFSLVAKSQRNSRRTVPAT